MMNIRPHPRDAKKNAGLHSPLHRIPTNRIVKVKVFRLPLNGNWPKKMRWGSVRCGAVQGGAVGWGGERGGSVRDMKQIVVNEICFKYTRRYSYNLLITQVAPNVAHKFQYVSYHTLNSINPRKHSSFLRLCECSTALIFRAVGCMLKFAWSIIIYSI